MGIFTKWFCPKCAVTECPTCNDCPPTIPKSATGANVNKVKGTWSFPGGREKIIVSRVSPEYVIGRSPKGEKTPPSLFIVTTDAGQGGFTADAERTRLKYFPLSDQLYFFTKSSNEKEGLELIREREFVETFVDNCKTNPMIAQATLALIFVLLYLLMLCSKN